MNRRKLEQEAVDKEWEQSLVVSVVALVFLFLLIGVAKCL